MKNKINKILVAVGLVASLAVPANAALFNESTLPGHATGAVPNNLYQMKKGESKLISILGLFEFGDGGVHTAAENGNVRKVSFVDYEKKNYIVFSKWKTTVYGD
ncbi:MAG: hypothetical protein HRT47_10875 [Candidatus Caenarcaniphilales bacterium]|nr:hypothetical protein [Candidatus Caenarcaniphilales bacterium]